MRVFRAAALLQNFSFESASLLKCLVNFYNSGDGTAVIRMQIHRQTQIIITEVAAAARRRERASSSAALPFYYMGMLAWCARVPFCGGLGSAADEQTSDRIWARDLHADCA
jgi:hypothetical protein